MKIESFRIGDRLMLNNLKDSINKMVASGSDVSKALFKAYINNESVDKRPIQIYLGLVNDFITSLNEYGVDLQKKMKSSEPSEPGKGLRYGIAKDYLYAKYDYLSVLPATEGMIKGIDDEKFKKMDDIKDFLSDVVKKAFDEEVFNPGAVVDSISEIFNDYNLPLDNTELARFKAVRDQKLVDPTLPNTMLKAFAKVLTYVSELIHKRSDDALNVVPMFTNVITSVVTYINFTAIVFAKRIAIIDIYAYPFLQKTKPVIATMECEDAICESALVSDLSKEVESTVGKEMEEFLCKDTTKIFDLIQSYIDFLHSINASADMVVETKDKINDDIPDEYAYGYKSGSIENNIFHKALLSNAVYEYIIHVNRWPRNDDVLKKKLDELRELVYSSRQAIKATSTPYNDFLYVLRNANINCNTLQECREVASDIATFVVALSCRIINNIIKYEQTIGWDGTHATIPDDDEMIRILHGIYTDINRIAMYRLKDIELRMNDMQNKLKQDVMEEISIKVPGLQSDISPNDNMMSASPDTTRVSKEVETLYTQPTMESLSLLDEYYKTVLDQNGGYLTEAFNVGGIVNSIIAAINAMLDKILSSLKNPKVKEAVTWVQNNRTKLLDAEYKGTMNVVPYGKDINLGFVRELVNSIRNIKDVNYPEGRDDFLNKLYGDPALVKLFTSNKDAKVKKQQFENWVIIGKEIPEGNDVNVQGVELKDDSIRTSPNGIGAWIDNVASANTIINEFDTFGKTLKAALTNVKNTVISATPKTESVIMEANENNNSQTQSTQTSGNDSTQSGQNSNDSQSEQAEKNDTKEDNKTQETTANQNEENKTENKTSSMEGIVKDIDKAISDMVIPLGSAVRDCILQQYKYIQQAYNLIVK